MAPEDPTDAQVEGQAQPAPVLRVVSPDATPEEIAALVAVLSVLGGQEPAPPRRVSEWSRPARRHRPAVSHGPGGWRSSSLPH